MRRSGDIELAAASYEQALTLSPGDDGALAALANATLAVCDWRRSSELGRRLIDQVRGSKSTFGPFALLPHCDDPALLLQGARNFVKQQVPAPPLTPSSAARSSHEQIRIAYVSADFRSHVMGYQLAELFELHDRKRFEVIGLSFSAMTTVRSANGWSGASIASSM